MDIICNNTDVVLSEAICDICEPTIGHTSTIWMFVILGFVRLIVNFGFIWLHPFTVEILSLYADTIDFTPWSFASTTFTRQFYDIWDKIFDSLYYVALIGYLFYFADILWYAVWVLPWIVYRLIGNIIFLATAGEEKVFLIIFPNVGEVLFIIYTFLDIIKVDRYLKKRWWANVILTVVVLAVKLVSEIFMHGKDEGMRSGHLACVDAWFQLAQFLHLMFYTALVAVILGLYTTPSFDRVRTSDGSWVKSVGRTDAMVYKRLVPRVPF